MIFGGVTEGRTLSLDGTACRISYSGGTGNDVTFPHQMTGVEAWRLLLFGTISSSGNAADNFDFDKDGLVNLIEFAFGLDPTQNRAGQLPQRRTIGSSVVVRINDRGPFVKGRIIDLSPAAAASLGLTKKMGITKVEVAHLH